MIHGNAHSRMLAIKPAMMIAVLLWASAGNLAGQDPVPAPPPPGPAQVTVPADTGATLSPRGAFLRSLVLPGWGQSYVGAPGRGALYFALESGTLWMTLRSRQQLRAARVQEAWLRESGQLSATAESPLAESRARQVEDWATVSIFLLFLAGADAYVAAQLADFGEHVGVRPTTEGGLRLEARVPTGGRR